MSIGGKSHGASGFASLTQGTKLFDKLAIRQLDRPAPDSSRASVGGEVEMR
jgi:hypothetical protein